MSPSAADREQAAEQAQLAVMYGRLDVLRDETEVALRRVRSSPTAGTPAARSERDSFHGIYSARLAQLRAVEEGMCFGRLDLLDGERRYVGRIGLFDEARTQLLVDWRAPAAEAFYQATAARPAGVVRRRHLSTRGREVTGVEDEVLDLDAVSAAQAGTIAGEGALLVALNAARTGRMRDIVATIQAEQDRIIRAPLTGVLVVQGGPGTGKTAVALHRTAYLLYTHRDRIARSGVLVVGPNPLFLRYIERVLPSLGETGVVMSTPGRLLPGLDATGTEDPKTAALKGDLRMAAVVGAAVRARQRVPNEPRRCVVEGGVVMLRPRDVELAQDKARRSGKPHNVAREVFVQDLLSRLARQLSRQQHVELDADHRADLIATLRDSRDVRREVNLCWMPLTPTKLVADIYADPERYGRQLPAAERALLQRERGAAWTPADVPLLDEAAELLGTDDRSDRAQAAVAAADRRAEREYAQGVTELFGSAGIVTADTLVERYVESAELDSVAERAGRDREWAYGHVVVDEAQELSPMQWRLLMRRCPSRSMTVVGDVAQTGALAGARSWAEVLDPYVAGRWRVEELTVNYRTPASIMTVAGDVLTAAGISATAPQSARDSDDPPVAQQVGPGDGSGLAAAVRAELDRLAGGRLAVITARADRDRVRAVLLGELPPDTVGAEALEQPVSVLGVDEAKGLEFDAVVVVEPAAVLAESPRGPNDLYVALTRPTQHLRVLHSGELPAGLRRLQPA